MSGERPPARFARCRLCGRRVSVAAAGDAAGRFPRHPPTGKRRCRTSGEPVPAGDYVGSAPAGIEVTP